jgi:chemotaxis signal transduction protein
MSEERSSQTSPSGADTCSFGQVVTFFLGGQRFALPIERVQEIQQIVAFSEVPMGNGSVVGMINLRGQVIPAIDLRQMVGMPFQDYDLETPMVICRVEGQLVALVVDEVQDVLDLPEDCMQAPPSMHALASKMVGVARLEDGLVYVLELDLLLTGVGGGL